MEETLRQLGELLLGSIPTILLFLVVYGSYRVVVHRPLTRVLQERYELTEGAIEKSRANIAAAEAKTAEYEQRLREAKLAIFKAQEARRQQALQARSVVVAQAREQAGNEISQARARIAHELETAKAQLEPESERLSSEVIRTILRPVAVAQTPAGGAQ